MMNLQRYRVEDRGYATACWTWTGALKPEGYGQVTLDGRGGRNVHRVIYELLVGPIQEGLHLDHLCRNRACVNPEHLEPVTCAENIRRGANVKLTLREVDLIRSRRAGGESMRSLASVFGVHSSQISRIVNRRHWLRDGEQPVELAATPPLPRCLECGTECAKRSRRFCSKRCVMLARHRENPEFRHLPKPRGRTA